MYTSATTNKRMDTLANCNTYTHKIFLNTDTHGHNKLQIQVYAQVQASTSKIRNTATTTSTSVTSTAAHKQHATARRPSTYSHSVASTDPYTP